MGRPKKQPAPPDLEQLHQVDEIEGVVLVEYREPDTVGWAGYYVDEANPDVAVGFQGLDGSVFVPNEGAGGGGQDDPAADEKAQAAAAAKRKRTKRPSTHPKVKKGDRVRMLFMAPGPKTAECDAEVVAVGKGGALDLRVDPMGKGNSHVRRGIPWGDGKTADTWR